MSGYSAPGGKPEKTMSSRLLTMKFMQRAAAASSPSNNNSSAPTTPPASSTTKRPPHHPRQDEGDLPNTPPSQKRQRLSSSGQACSDASSPIPTPRTSDLEAIALAKAAEDQKRSAALAKYAAEAGETRWVLDFGPGGDVHRQCGRGGADGSNQPYIVSAQSVDSVDGQNQYTRDDDTTLLSGRQCYGNYKRKKKSQFQSADDYDEDMGQFEGGDENSNRHHDNMADPAHVHAVRRRAQQNADRKAGHGKYGGPPKEVDLRKITSISGGGGAGGGGGHGGGRKRGRDDRRR